MTPVAAPTLIAPYGGTLVDLLVPAEALEERKAYASHLASLQISERSVCDLELLTTGAFSPLDRFMGQADYQRVLDEMRLASGVLFPIPITLPVDQAAPIEVGQDIALRNAKYDLLAIMTVEEIYPWDLEEVAQKVWGTHDQSHPVLAEMRHWGRRNISGRLQVLAVPGHSDFRDIRLTPAQTRERLQELGRRNVVAFHTSNLLHRAQEELTRRATEDVDGVLLLHPSVGLARPGDVDHFTRVRGYKTLVERYYEPGRVLLSLLPLAPRMAGPREVLWHALIRRNYGASSLIVERGHTGSQDSATVVQQYGEELGIDFLFCDELVYLPDEDRYEEVSKVSPMTRTASISETRLRDEYLNQGKQPPSWFTRPEIAEILAERYPARHHQGVCIWFTGLSGAGKSTISEVLTVLLLEHGRQSTVLDGDVVRTHLSKGLGFSKDDRDVNIRRIGFVAAELVRHGGVVLCAAVSPYRATRDDVRTMVGTEHFVEVFVDTPLEVCEGRDVKGMYAKARRGEIKDFTGIDDPYEPPLHPEITVDTVANTPSENARAILEYLRRRGFVRSVTGGGNGNGAD